MQHSPVSEEEKKKKYQEMVLSRWPYILLGCLVFTLGTTGYCIWRCCCRKGRKGGDGKFAGFFKRGGRKDGSGTKGLNGEEMNTGFLANTGRNSNSNHKAQDENSAYYPLSNSNNLSMYALNRTNSNHSQHQQPQSYSSPSRSNLNPNNPYSNSQAWDDGSTYSLQGGHTGGGPPSPSAAQHSQSAYAMNPHAMGSVASVHMQRQPHEYGGGYGGNEYAGQYSR